jgi:hypothetical protein
MLYSGGRAPQGALGGEHGNGFAGLPNSRLMGWHPRFFWERLVKKGRHRRFEEARSLKRAIETTVEPCPECGADPEEEHASWCLYESEELDEPEDLDVLVTHSHQGVGQAEHSGAQWGHGSSGEGVQPG